MDFNYAKIVQNNYLTPANIDSFKFVKGDKVRVYKNDEGTFVISHRGTKLTDKDDILSDTNIALRNERNDKQFINRTNETENLIREIKQSNPNSKIVLTGHSLGGSTSLHSMENNQYIRDNVDQVIVYNMGKHIGGYTINPETKKKLIEYQVEGDLISTGGTGASRQIRKTTPISFAPILFSGKNKDVIGVFGTIFNHSIRRWI